MDDLISRQAAIDAIRASTKKYTGFMEMEMYTDDDAVEAIINLPPAQPERMRGRWIKLDMHAHLADHKCTACGQECYVPTCMGEPMYIYCPNCGAQMDGGEQE